jgi:hypothetical protein
MEMKLRQHATIPADGTDPGSEIPIHRSPKDFKDQIGDLSGQIMDKPCATSGQVASAPRNKRAVKVLGWGQFSSSPSDALYTLYRNVRFCQKQKRRGRKVVTHQKERARTVPAPLATGR